MRFGFDLSIPCVAVRGGVAAPTEPPGDIADLTATAIDDDSVQLAFTNATGASSHEYRIDGGSAAALPGNKIVSGLDPSTEYDFEVRGVNGAGDGDWSNVATETTEAADGFAPAMQFNDARNSMYAALLGDF